MFWLYLILGIVGGLILLIVIFGFLSPRYTYMKRTIEINCSPDKAFNSVNNLKSFVDHVSPWTGMDPNAMMQVDLTPELKETTIVNAFKTLENYFEFTDGEWLLKPFTS